MTARNVSSIAWLAPVILVLAGAAPLTAQTLERPPTTTPTVYAAGPAWVTAAGYIPTRIMLKWKSVPNAWAYQVYRSSGIEMRHLVGEYQVANLAGNYEIDGSSYFGPDSPVDMTSTYTYDVRAVFVDANGSRTFSAGSPAATAKSPPFVAPSNFKYSAGLYATPGKFRLTFTWDPVPNAQQYDVLFQAMNGRTMSIPAKTAIKATTLVIDDVPPHSQYNVCIITVYLPSIRDDNVRSCVAVNIK
jgi:hypothetical protein